MIMIADLCPIRIVLDFTLFNISPTTHSYGGGGYPPTGDWGGLETMSDEDRHLRILYTQTLLDILVSAAEGHKDKELRYVLREVRAKGYKKAEVLEYANEHLEPEAIRHLKTVIASMGRGSRKAG